APHSALVLGHRAGLVLAPGRGTRAHTRANPTTALVAMTPGGGETWQRKEDAARSRGGTTAGTVCSIAAVTLSRTASTTTGGSQRGPRRWNDMRSPRRHRRVNEYRL